MLVGSLRRVVDRQTANTLARALRLLCELRGSDERASSLLAQSELRGLAHDCCRLLSESDENRVCVESHLFGIARRTTTSTTTTTTNVCGTQRHDNDNVDYRAVRLIPTADELRYRASPTIRAANAHSDRSVLEHQFRLLREDLVAPLRAELLGTEGRGGRERVLHGVQVRRVLAAPSADRCRRPLRARVELSFRQPLSASSNAKQVRHWWENTNMLKEGALVLLHNADLSWMVLGEVYGRDDTRIVEPTVGFVTVELVDTASLRATLLRLRDTPTNVSLRQASASFFAYKPVLQRLQAMHRIPLGDILFRGSTNTPPRHYNVRIQNVLRRVVDANDSTDLRCELAMDTRREPLCLNASQRKAMLVALTRRVAIIQGPPGTGKSFVGALVADTLRRFTEARIMVVCYTNHALDQFLEDLLAMGVPAQEVVRVGGSVGKVSEKVRPLMMNDADVRQRVAAPSKEMRYEFALSLKEAEKELDEYRRQVIQAEKELEHQLTDFAALRSVMSDEETAAFAGIDGTDDASFTIVDNGATEDLWKKWCKGKGLSNAQRTRLNDACELWKLRRAERAEKRVEWARESASAYVDALVSAMHAYNQYAAKITSLKCERDVRVLESARVIGCTTTGAAKHHALLSSVQTDVLMVEEAGEILEAHILTSLSDHCKHLIMIGDHEQLRPKLNHYELTVESGHALGRVHRFNVSLFERLVESGFNHVTLSTQRRMQPDVSRIVRELTPSYCNLKDAASVREYPSVPGVTNSVMWINHKEMERNHEQLRERRANRDLSIVNDYEVGMSVALVRHLLSQSGLTASSIVVLTPYVAQLLALKEAMDATPFKAFLDQLDRSELRRMDIHVGAGNDGGVRVATIDNFQGEEADIVIVSLVRANEHTLGFLDQRQRVNVLLSRARHGMIILGNARYYRHAKKETARRIWSTVLKNIMVVNGVPLRCERHGAFEGVAECAEDFERLAPYGGCTEPCLFEYVCGHRCLRACHAMDAQHVDEVNRCVQCVELHKLEMEIKRARRRAMERQAELQQDLERAKARARQCNEQAAAEAKAHELKKAKALEVIRMRQRRREQHMRREAAGADLEAAIAECQVEAAMRMEELELRMEEERRVQEERLASECEKAQRDVEALRADAAALVRESEAALKKEQERIEEEKRRILDVESERLRAVQERLVALTSEGPKTVETARATAFEEVSRLRQCSVCMEDVAAFGGLACGECNAFACDDCFDAYAASEATTAPADFLRDAQIRCIECRQKLASNVIQRHARGAGGMRLLRAVQELNQQEGRRRAEEEANERRRREALLSEAERKVTKARNDIVDLMCDHCPNERCRRVFADYGGCAALKCTGEGGCGAFFCALCLRRCATDQECHAHVMRCRYNSEDDVFVSQRLFALTRRMRHRRNVQEYLATVDDDTRDEVIRLLLGELCELGVIRGEI